MMNPFRSTPADAFSRPGLNALLQTDLMVIHPPVVFAYYTLCIGVGVHAISAMLIPGAPARDRILHLARPALWVGTLGVGLGGLWAYTVLDWGGYWAWDPVETGSLLPWLALVILLHLRLPRGWPRRIIGSLALGFYRPSFRFMQRWSPVPMEFGRAFMHSLLKATSILPWGRFREYWNWASVMLQEWKSTFTYSVLAGMLCHFTRHFADDSNQEWAPLGILTGALMGLQIGTLEVGILAGVFGLSTVEPMNQARELFGCLQE